MMASPPPGRARARPADPAVRGGWGSGRHRCRSAAAGACPWLPHPCRRPQVAAWLVSARATREATARREWSSCSWKMTTVRPPTSTHLGGVGLPAGVGGGVDEAAPGRARPFARLDPRNALSAEDTGQRRRRGRRKAHRDHPVMDADRPVVQPRGLRGGAHLHDLLTHLLADTRRARGWAPGAGLKNRRLALGQGPWKISPPEPSRTVTPANSRYASSCRAQARPVLGNRSSGLSASDRLRSHDLPLRRLRGPSGRTSVTSVVGL